MSNGNMLLGYARGKVGSLVFSRNKGKQVTAAYNSSPANPRSESQMTQRATFLGVQKFFTKGRQAFFRFAFEDKKTKESEFAAFMRNNIKRGVMLSKEAFNNATYPAMGNFVMTKGSLGVVKPYYNTSGKSYDLNLPGLTANSKFGDLSKYLKAYYGAQDGDIVTLCVIVAYESTAENTPEVYPSDREPVNWTIVQATVDSNSTSNVSDVFQNAAVVSADTFSFGILNTDEYIGAACMVISRQTKRGLKVTTSYLQPNSAAESAIAAAKADPYVSGVLESWGATPQAILQGNG